MKPRFRFSLLSVLGLVTLFAFTLSVVYWSGSTERAIRADIDLPPSTTLEIITPVYRNDLKKHETVWLLLHDDKKYKLRVLHRALARDSRWISPKTFNADAKDMTEIELLSFLILQRRPWHFADRPDQKTIDEIIDDYMYSNRFQFMD